MARWTTPHSLAPPWPQAPPLARREHTTFGRPPKRAACACSTRSIHCETLTLASPFLGYTSRWGLVDRSDLERGGWEPGSGLPFRRESDDEESTLWDPDRRRGGSGSDRARRSFGLRLESFWVVVGGLFFLAGFWELNSIDVDLLPILLILAGDALMLSLFRRGSRSDWRDWCGDSSYRGAERWRCCSWSTDNRRSR